MKKEIAWLLSVFMIFSLFMGNSNVKAQNQVTGNQYKVDFGTGTWEIGSAKVSAKLATTATSSDLASGEKTISESDIIQLEGFNAETMEAYLSKTDGFKAYLSVTEGKTSLLNRDSNTWLNTDDTFTFVVAKKGSGTSTPPQQDYNNFSATDDKPILLEIIVKNGKITLPEGISGDDKCWNGENVKVRIATGTDLTISWNGTLKTITIGNEQVENVPTDGKYTINSESMSTQEKM